MAGPGHGKFRSTVEVWRGLSYQVGIRDNGTFRIWADQRLKTALPAPVLTNGRR